MWRASRNIYERSRDGYFWQPECSLLLAVSLLAVVPAVSRAFPITIVDMDRASQVLAQGLPPDVPRTWAVLSERGDVPLTTLYYRAHGRPSIEEKA